jgi:hypothetical protein
MIAGGMSAILLSPILAQQQRVTWTEAIEYVAQHGLPSSFYGPVAKSLGLSDGGTVSGRVLSIPGEPKRDFYVTEKAVVLSATWRSGISRAYTASRGGQLLGALERNTVIPVAQAAGGFQAEKSWWLASISAENK